MAELTTQEYIAGLVAKARVAQAQFEAQCKTQKDADMAIRTLDLAILEDKVKLAEWSVEETGMGTVEYKIGKIEYLAYGMWNEMRGKKSMGFIDNPNPNEPGVRVIAKPIGVVGIVCPTTNPIISILGNGMQAIKCRNACIVAPHPKAKNVSNYCVDLIRKAFKENGIPEDLIQCIAPEYSSIESTGEMLKQCDTNIGTGGPGIVKAVYSSGKPGFGVGQGNCQDIICEDWEDYDSACAQIAANRAWDEGVPCTSDQMCHVPADKEEVFLAAMEKGGAYILKTEEEIDKLRKYVFPVEGGPINRDVVGKTPQVVGKVLGWDVPEDRIIFLAKVTGTGRDDDLCRECLFPFTRYRTYTGDYTEAVDAAVKNLKVEGQGHNSAIWTNCPEKVDYAALRVPVSRFYVNLPTVGDHGTAIPMSTTLGCGFWCNNSISEQFTYKHMFQTTRVAVNVHRREVYKPGDFDRFDECPLFE